MIFKNSKTMTLKRKYARLNRKIAKLRARMRKLEESREETVERLESIGRIHIRREFY